MCVVILLVGFFLFFVGCIFGKAILLLFQKFVGGGTRPCVLYLSILYCCHSHFSLVVGMVMRCLPVSSYICVISFCICIVFISVAMFFSGLHSVIIMWVCGNIVGGGINLGSLICVGVRCAFTMLL